MPYKLNLHPASFRGVSFGVMDSQTSGGRRTAIHEFPQRDKPYTEDLGRKARSYTVDAFVVGEKHQEKRDELTKALEEIGPGELIHPWLGKINVQVTTFSFRDSWQDGGYTAFSIEFTETQDVIYPEVEKSAIDSITEAATATEEAAAEMFESEFATSSIKELAEAESKVSESVNEIEKSFISQIALAASSKLSQFVKQVANTITNVSTLIRKPLSLAYRMMGLVRTLASATTDAVNAVEAYKRFFTSFREFCGESKKQYNEKTQYGKAALKNMQAIQDAVSVSCVTSASIAVVSMQYGTQVRSSTPAVDVAGGSEQEDELLQPGQIYLTGEDIQKSKYAVLDMIDVLKEDVNDTLYEALLQLQQVLSDMPMPTPADVRFIKRIEINNEMNSLVLSYRLYGSLDNTEDIVCRNKITNPAFIPSGTEIEVVTNE